MNIALNNRQKVEKPCLPALRRLAQYLYHCAVTPGKASACSVGKVHIVLTDNRMIRKLKSTYFHIDEITDVIAVNYQPIPAGSAQIDGEIFVNIELAVKRGRANAAHELALYIAHGLDHLTGAEDTTSIERRQMRRRELRWLSKAAAEGLLAKIFNHPCACRRFPSAPTLRLHV